MSKQIKESKTFRRWILISILLIIFGILIIGIGFYLKDECKNSSSPRSVLVENFINPISNSPPPLCTKLDLISLFGMIILFIGIISVLIIINKIYKHKLPFWFLGGFIGIVIGLVFGLIISVIDSGCLMCISVFKNIIFYASLLTFTLIGILIGLIVKKVRRK